MLRTTITTPYFRNNLAFKQNTLFKNHKNNSSQIKGFDNRTNNYKSFNHAMKGLEFVFLAAGSVLGAFLRYKITETPLLFNMLPVNVLIVNLAGSFILGSFVVLSHQWNIESKYSLFAAVGFCGSLTTMSAFALDSSNLLENNQYGTLIINIVANVGLSIGALIGGKSLMNAIFNN